jgi:hypothetical protein
LKTHYGRKKICCLFCSRFQNGQARTIQKSHLVIFGQILYLRNGKGRVNRPTHLCQFKCVIFVALLSHGMSRHTGIGWRYNWVNTKWLNQWHRATFPF